MRWASFILVYVYLYFFAESWNQLLKELLRVEFLVVSSRFKNTNVLKILKSRWIFD